MVAAARRLPNSNPPIELGWINEIVSTAQTPRVGQGYQSGQAAYGRSDPQAVSGLRILRGVRKLRTSVSSSPVAPATRSRTARMVRSLGRRLELLNKRENQLRN